VWNDVLTVPELNAALAEAKPVIAAEQEIIVEKIQEIFSGDTNRKNPRDLLNELLTKFARFVAVALTK
jgi:hypothetical protein